MIDMWAKIGETAGKVYHLLEDREEKSLSQIERTLRKEGYNSNIVKMAIGWLAREDKICVLRDGKKWVIKLK